MIEKITVLENEKKKMEVVAGKRKNLINKLKAANKDLTMKNEELNKN
jgi:hypothetical protein